MADTWIRVNDPKNMFNLDSLKEQLLENVFAHGYNFCLFDQQLKTGKPFLYKAWAVLGIVCLDWATKKGRTVKDMTELPHACMSFFVEGLN